MKIEAHRKIVLGAILALLFIPLLTHTAHGDDWVSEFKLTAGIHAAAFDQFGYSVDISGDTAVVGVPIGESAYVYRFDGTDWKQEKQLVAPTFYFGWDVAINGDTLVVSGFNYLWLHGSVYVFTRSGDSWDDGQELITGPGVGASVAVSGDTAVVGAPSSLSLLSQLPSGPNAVYVLRKQNDGTWQNQNLSTPAVDGFGASVAISGDRLVVGAPTDDVVCPDAPSCNSGSVYLFRYDGENWVQDPLQPTLIPTVAPSPEQFDQFGWAVAIDSSTVV
ncbi:MAG: FG-GAP repeat protein, partial [Deltaproteobacteria bacterium]